MTEAKDLVRPLLRTRQVRDFTDEPVSDAILAALAEVARWTGSSRNEQPWQFIVIRDGSTLRRILEIGMPQTRPFRTATAAIATVLPADPAREVHDAYDDGRVAERLLVAATLLDLGAGIAWIRQDVREAIGALLHLPRDRFIRSMVAFGHPSEIGRRPKSEPGRARLPIEQVLLEERWPQR